MSRDITKVEVLARYSRSQDVQERLQKARAAVEAATQRAVAKQTRRRVHKLAVRLDETVLQSIVDDYVAGATSLQLARRHRVAKSTVLKLLHDRGVRLRPKWGEHY